MIRFLGHLGRLGFLDFIGMESIWIIFVNKTAVIQFFYSRAKHNSNVSFCFCGQQLFRWSVTLGIKGMLWPAEN